MGLFNIHMDSLDVNEDVNFYQGLLTYSDGEEFFEKVLGGRVNQHQLPEDAVEYFFEQEESVGGADESGIFEDVLSDTESSPMYSNATIDGNITESENASIFEDIELDYTENETDMFEMVEAPADGGNATAPNNNENDDSQNYIDSSEDEKINPNKKLDADDILKVLNLI